MYGNRLLAITIGTGASQTLATLPGFKDGDDPSELVRTETGLLVRSQTNVQFVNYTAHWCTTRATSGRDEAS